jgi:hypothetical protein
MDRSKIKGGQINNKDQKTKAGRSIQRDMEHDFDDQIQRSIHGEIRIDKKSK